MAKAQVQLGVHKQSMIERKHFAGTKYGEELVKVDQGTVKQKSGNQRWGRGFGQDGVEALGVPVNQVEVKQRRRSKSWLGVVQC